jgi:hypothetical protein
MSKKKLFFLIKTISKIPLFPSKNPIFLSKSLIFPSKTPFSLLKNSGKVGYIATQGPRLDPTSPLKNTAGDFWDMVLDRGAGG